MNAVAAVKLESAQFPTFEIPEFENRNAPRFFVQMVDDVLSMDSPGIPNRELLRGVITPCVSTRQILPLFEIREGDLIKGSETRDFDGPNREGKLYYGQVWRPAKFEADRLVNLESETRYKTGLVEIVSLRDAPRVYSQNINRIFYDGLAGSPLPETNAELRVYLVGRLEEIKRAGASALADPDDHETLVKAGDELIAAVDYADNLQRRSLEITHTCMKLPPADADFKKSYDPKDEMYLRRTGVRRLSEIDQRMVLALEGLAGGNAGVNSNDDIKELIQEMRQQNAEQRQIIANQQEMIKGLVEGTTKKGAK